METAKHCPNCGKPLSDKAIQGLCPECLIKAGWPTQDSASSAADDRFVPPAIEALADLFPQLDILELIGQGGMGAVYKARQPELDRLVALKILAKKDGSDPGFAERFTREARALAKLSHPHIVAVYDFGHAGDLSYFIMEYVDGTNLRQIEKTGSLKPKEALAIIPQICEALQFAHDAGVVHRDIKPENVLLDQKGNVKIADFGLAKILGQAPADFTLTEANHVMGTPHYMAPEQVEHPLEVDHRADIYSLGVVFYEMLTGELPLGKFDPPSRKVQVDVRLDEVVLRTLEKEPQRRYQQASEVRTEVETIASYPDQGCLTLIKSSRCGVSTPQYHQTDKGRFSYVWQAKGELRLNRESLKFQSDWQVVTIPLTSIERIAKGVFPKTLKPKPIYYLEITFREHGESRTLLFTPYLHTVGFNLSHESTVLVQEWLDALLNAIQDYTGHRLSVEETHTIKSLPGDLQRFLGKLFGGMALGFLITNGIVYLIAQSFQPSLWINTVLFTVLAIGFSWIGRWKRRHAYLSDINYEYPIEPNNINHTSNPEPSFWIWTKRLALLSVTGFLILIMGMLTASVVLPWLHRVRFTATHVFGPIVERRFMRSDMEEGQIVFWDLDSNILVEPPFAVEVPNDSQLFMTLSPSSLQDNPQLKQWLNDLGVDLAMVWTQKPNGVSFYLMGVGAERLNPSFQERPFNSVRPAQLIERETCALRVVLTFDSNHPSTRPPSTLCIRTDQGVPGILERERVFDGTTDGVKIRYKLLENRSDKRTELELRDESAMPIIERELHASGVFDNDLFDFSTNRVFEFPDEVQFWDMPQWMAERSIDIACINSEDGPTLTGNGRINGYGGNICKFVKTELELDCSYRDLLEHWQEKESQEVIDHGGWNHLPQRFFFKSLSGDRGIVEIMQIDAIEQSIRFRYKLFVTAKDIEGTPQSLTTDFNDPNFWQAQISKHLQGVRTLDAELIMERHIYDNDQNEQERRSRYRFNLKWNRDHQWIDCRAESIGRQGFSHRIIQGDKYGWIYHGTDNWTKVKAGAGSTMMPIFAGFGEVRSHPYEHAFSVAQGIICSDTIQRTQAQGVIDWHTVELVHSTDAQDRHILRHSQPMPLPDGKVVNADLVLIGVWEQEAFKLLEVRGQVQELGTDELMEVFKDHIFVDGVWVPGQATLYRWVSPAPDGQEGMKPARLCEKIVVTAQSITVNQTMTATMFDGFEPPIGDDVSDEITGTHYRVWPDTEKIRAAGGKERVSIHGRVYLDGRPQAGIVVTTSTYFDPNSMSSRKVETETDEKGQFRLNELIPGFSYRIRATHSSGYTAEAKVHLSELGLDYTGLKIDMTSGLSVSGQVTDPNGQPISGALVRFSGKSSIQTDAQGRYTVHGLYADQGYEVEAAAWGYAPLDPGGDTIRENFNITLDANGVPKPFDIVLPRERILSGRVMDQNDQPVPGIRINVWDNPFGSEAWAWYDAHTDANGYFQIGNLGKRIYTFFVGQYGNVYHSPKESPLLFKVTGDSFMPDTLPGRKLVESNVLARVNSFEQPYLSYFRLKEFQKASIRNNDGKLIQQWLEELNVADKAKRLEILARLGSVPATSAIETLEMILCGHVVQKRRGIVNSVDSNLTSMKDSGLCPADLIDTDDPDIICLAMRALARFGFTEDHASLLIDKLDHRDQQVRDHALVALAELTGVYVGPEKTHWLDWLKQYQTYRTGLDSRSPERLFASLCRVCRDQELDQQTIDQIMTAWQGGSKAAMSFRERLRGGEAQQLWQSLASIDVDNEDSVKYKFILGYWPSEMFRDKGYQKHGLKFRFVRQCTLGKRTFEPGVWYALPALFRNGFKGQWEIVDLRLDDIELLENPSERESESEQRDSSLDLSAESHTANPFVQALSQGTIELVAVSGDVDGDVGWWKPDGSLWMEGPFQVSPGEKFSKQVGESMGDRSVYRLTLRGQGLPEQVSWSGFRIKDASATLYTQILGPDGLEDPNLRVLEVSVPSDTQRIDVDIAVAAGPWERVAVYEPNQSEERHVFLEEGTSVTLGPCSKPNVQGTESYDRGRAWIKLTHGRPNHQLRAVAFDHHGLAHSSPVTTVDHKGDITQTIYQFELANNEVRTFELLIRPYQWMTFKGVTVQPSR